MTDEEKIFASEFARTFSLKGAAEIAGFGKRTPYAKCALLLEREEIREFIKSEIGKTVGYSETEGRLLREYEKIAFADITDKDIKVADKLRALECYRSITEKHGVRDDESVTVNVNYDYGEKKEDY